MSVIRPYMEVDPEEYKAMQAIKARLDVVKQMLTDMQRQFNFQFTFSFVVLQEQTNKIIVSDGFFTQNPSLTVTNAFLAPMEEYRRQLQQIFDQVNQGKLIVLCHNDRAQSLAYVDLLKMNQAYEARHIHIKESKHYYVLKNMNNGETEGYDSDRFSILLTHQMGN